MVLLHAVPLGYIGHVGYKGGGKKNTALSRLTHMHLLCMLVRVCLYLCVFKCVYLCAHVCLHQLKSEQVITSHSQLILMDGG